MKKNIWVINQYIDTPPDFYGHRHYCLAKYWSEEGHSVTLINGSYSHTKVDKSNNQSKNFVIKYLSNCLSIVTIKIPSYPTSDSIFRFWNMLIFMIKLFFLPTKKLPKPDIIIVSSTSLLPIINGFFLRRKFKNSKFILEIRDIWPLTLVELNNTSKWHPIVILLGLIECFGYKTADLITSTINHADLHIKKIVSKPINFDWIGNGILPENFNPNIESEIKLPINKFNITYVGTLGNANAMEFLIQAAITSKNDTSIHYNIFGEGYYLNVLKNMASNLNNITYYGRIPNKEVFGIYKQSDTLYLSWRKKEIYKYGISANKLYEYLLSAKPIIMSGDFIESDPISLSGGGIVIPSENSLEILNAINILKQMPIEERQKLGEKGRDYVLKFHTYSYLAKKYLDIMNTLKE